MSYTRRNTTDGATIMNKDLYDNLQDGIEEHGVKTSSFSSFKDCLEHCSLKGITKIIIDSSISFKEVTSLSNVILEGNGNSISIESYSSSIVLGDNVELNNISFVFNREVQNNAPFFLCDGSENIKFFNVNIENYNSLYTFIQIQQSSQRVKENKNFIFLSSNFKNGVEKGFLSLWGNCDNLVIKNCNFYSEIGSISNNYIAMATDFPSEVIDRKKRITIDGCSFSNSNRMAIEIFYGYQIEIKNCKFLNIKGFDISIPTCREVSIFNNDFKGITGNEKPKPCLEVAGESIKINGNIFNFSDIAFGKFNSNRVYFFNNIVVKGSISNNPNSSVGIGLEFDMLINSFSNLFIEPYSIHTCGLFCNNRCISLLPSSKIHFFSPFKVENNEFIESSEGTNQGGYFITTVLREHPTYDIFCKNVIQNKNVWYISFRASTLGEGHKRLLIKDNLFDTNAKTYISITEDVTKVGNYDNYQEGSNSPIPI
jgi:hypothetical protein